MCNLFGAFHKGTAQALVLGCGIGPAEMRCLSIDMHLADHGFAWTSWQSCCICSEDAFFESLPFRKRQAQESRNVPIGRDPLEEVLFGAQRLVGDILEPERREVYLAPSNLAEADIVHKSRLACRDDFLLYHLAQVRLLVAGHDIVR